MVLPILVSLFGDGAEVTPGVGAPVSPSRALFPQPFASTGVEDVGVEEREHTFDRGSGARVSARTAIPIRRGQRDKETSASRGIGGEAEQHPVQESWWRR